jgi:hypothetical protein
MRCGTRVSGGRESPRSGTALRSRSATRGRSTLNALMPSLRWMCPKHRTRRSVESSSADHVATQTCLPRALTASTAGTKSSSPDTSTAAS